MGTNEIKSEGIDVSENKPPVVVSGKGEGLSTSPSVEEVDRLKKDLRELRDDFKREKSNNLVVFGIFASLIGFLSIEVKLFSSVTDPLVIIGVSLFFLGALGMFLLLLTHISNVDPKNTIEEQSLIKIFYNPILWTTIICLAVGIILVMYSSIITKTNPKQDSPKDDVGNCNYLGE